MSLRTIVFSFLLLLPLVHPEQIDYDNADFDSYDEDSDVPVEFGTDTGDILSSSFEDEHEEPEEYAEEEGEVKVVPAELKLALAQAEAEEAVPDEAFTYNEGDFLTGTEGEETFGIDVPNSQEFVDPNGENPFPQVELETKQESVPAGESGVKVEQVPQPIPQTQSTAVDPGQTKDTTAKEEVKFEPPKNSANIETAKEKKQAERITEHANIATNTEPAKDLAKDPVKEPAKDPAKEPARDPAKEPAKTESVKVESAIDSVKETKTNPAKGTKEESKVEATKGPAKVDPSKLPAKEATKPEPPKDSAKNAVKSEPVKVESVKESEKIPTRIESAKVEPTKELEKKPVKVEGTKETENTPTKILPSTAKTPKETEGVQAKESLGNAKPSKDSVKPEQQPPVASHNFPRKRPPIGNYREPYNKEEHVDFNIQREKEEPRHHLERQPKGESSHLVKEEEAVVFRAPEKEVHPEIPINTKTNNFDKFASADIDYVSKYFVFIIGGIILSIILVLFFIGAFCPVSEKAKRSSRYIDTEHGLASTSSEFDSEVFP